MLGWRSLTSRPSICACSYIQAQHDTDMVLMLQQDLEGGWLRQWKEETQRCANCRAMKVYLPGRSSWLWCWSPWGGWTSPNRKLCWGKTADLFQSENPLGASTVYIYLFLLFSPLLLIAQCESWLIQHLQHFNFMEYASAATQRFISYWCRAGPWVCDEDSLHKIPTYRCANSGKDLEKRLLSRWLMMRPSPLKEPRPWLCLSRGKSESAVEASSRSEWAELPLFKEVKRFRSSRGPRGAAADSAYLSLR